MRARVAILEDDVALREDILVPQLGAVGFDVEGFGASAELYRRMEVVAFELLVLDLRLENESGLDVARRLHAISPIAIVVLTGRGTRAEQVEGLSESVDAWLAKPVEVDVLVATMQSLLRRL
ncbi:MAG TPA: response regulator, partial [Dokdonella sp.]